ncbi:unnamed protein product, partial [Nesidiocoris tenuis]
MSLTSHRNTDFSLCRATKHLKRPTVQAPPIKNPTNNEWLKTNQEKADIFSRHLADTFKPFPGSPDEPPLKYGSKKSTFKVEEHSLNVPPTDYDKAVWCLDSGTTSHTCSERSKFSTLSSSEGGVKLASEGHTANIS